MNKSVINSRAMAQLTKLQNYDLPFFPQSTETVLRPSNAYQSQTPNAKQKQDEWIEQNKQPKKLITRDGGTEVQRWSLFDNNKFEKTNSSDTDTQHTFEEGDKSECNASVKPIPLPPPVPSELTPHQQSIVQNFHATTISTKNK